jgi:aminoglycoside phosphotransferase (APT) family kinase protein
VDELIALGVPDRRLAHVAAEIKRVVGGSDPRLTALVSGLDERLATVESCGLPETLVHGDLHPGNAHGDDRRRVLFDWGDSTIGHPAFDILRLTEGLPEPEGKSLIDAWAARWRAAVPGSDPHTCVELLRPVAAARNAASYAYFVEHIERTEHPYHAADVGAWLEIAAEAMSDQ